MSSVNEESIMLKEKIKLLLTNQDYINLEKYCTQEETLPQIAENGWDILTLLMDFLKNEPVNETNLLYFEHLFLHIASISKPKEIFFGILEHFDPMIDIALVNLLFPALNECIKRLIKHSRHNYASDLNMLFSTLLYYSESLNLPKYDNYKPLQNIQNTDEIKISLYIIKCANVIKIILSNLIPHSGNADNEKNEASSKDIHTELKKFCIGLLARLSYLDLDEVQSPENTIDSSCTNTDGSKSNAEPLHDFDRQSVKSAYGLCAILRNFESPYEMFKILSWSDWLNEDLKLTEEECKLHDLARAVYVYLNLVKMHEAYYFPQVLNPEYVFLNCVPSILALWNTSIPVHIHKGMEIAQFVCNRIIPETLHSGYINHWLRSTKVFNGGKQMLDSVTDIAVHCQTTLLRERAVQFIKKFLDKFDWPDRYHLLLRMLITSKHSGVTGYVIGYFKDKLSDVLHNQSSKKSEYFLDKRRFKSVIDICCNLSDGSETDLLSGYDKIISSLNLLRFLLIRDTSNKTGINEQLTSIQKQFLNPLRTAINLSRMHFSNELSKQFNPKKQIESNEPALVINGISLPSLPVQDRKQTLNSAINSFDLLQSICIRVQELVDHRS